jgi:hypothetical protein
MAYYHINRDNLTIISGPHSERSAYIKQLTSCGNPELLDLTSFGLVPLVSPPLGPGQRYGEGRAVYVDRVEVSIEEIPWQERQDVLIGELENAVDQHIRTVCTSKGYDSEDSLSKYMARPNSPWYAECIALGDWIDACWLKCHEVLNAIIAEERPAPTAEELLTELPAIE